MPGPVAEYVAQYTPEGIQRKLEQISKDASVGSGSWFELYQQNFTHEVDYWISQTPQPELKERIRSAAIAGGDYEPNPGGRWVPDIENNDLEWRAEYRHTEASALRERIDRLTTEREQLHTVTVAAEAGELAQRDIPSDIYTYYGRVHKLDMEIAAGREEASTHYEKAMHDVRDMSARGVRVDVIEIGTLKSLEELQAATRLVGAEIADRAVNADDQSISQWLSNDDFVEAYRQGGNAELTRWYWEQKRENALGHAQPREGNLFRKGEHMEQEMAFVPSQKFVMDQLVSFHKDLKRAIELLPEGPNAQVYATAATNHYQGRATEWNSWREAIVANDPNLEKALPAALVVEEIQVNRQVREWEKTVDRGLAVGR